MNEPTPFVRPSMRSGHEYHVGRVFEHQWCDSCALPSALVVRMILIDRRRPDLWLGVALHFLCRRCGDERYAPGRS